MPSNVPLSDLWLPILLSGVAVFVLSNVIHMVLGYHKYDYVAFPKEDQVMEALRAFHIPPGDYMAPRPASMASMKDPAFIDKRNKGPVMVATIMPSGPMHMGPLMGQWLLYTLVVSLFAGYMGSASLAPGASSARIIQIVGCAAFMGYGLALWPLSIWYKRSWGTTFRGNVDALIYALGTAGVFCWLWPH